MDPVRAADIRQGLEPGCPGRRAGEAAARAAALHREGQGGVGRAEAGPQTFAFPIHNPAAGTGIPNLH